MIRLLFMGSGTFPTPILKVLSGNKVFNICGLVTSAFSKIGQDKSDVINEAVKHNIPIYQPNKLKEQEKEILEQTQPDIILVASYGKIISDYILSYPRFKCLNIHGSLLPILRGACPIEMSIVQDFLSTGFSVQLMEKTMDTGDILFQKEIPIDQKETGGSLRKKFQKTISAYIEKILKDWIEGKTHPQKQDNSKATYCYRSDISKQATEIDWKEDAFLIERKIRAFNPQPIAWSTLNSIKGKKRIKIFESAVSQQNISSNPGETKREKGSLFIQTGNGVIEPLIVQLEGKSKIGIMHFMNGWHEKIIFSRKDKEEGS